MAQHRTHSRLKTRLYVATASVLFALLSVACDGFYSDSVPTPPVAQPTPVSVQDGDPEELVEAGARTALAAVLGIPADAPRKILLQGETWTERNSGCYPPPPGVTGPYLVPGYRLLLQYEDVFYEYNADQGGATGELCAETLQLVPVEPALEIVTANPTAPASPDFDTVHILRSEEDVVEFNSNNPDIATVAVNQIDWDIEVLVGGWVDIGPATEVVRAYQSPADPTGTLIAIEIATVNPEDLPEQPEPAPSQAWVLVDITRPDSTYEFVVQNGN